MRLPLDDFFAVDPDAVDDAETEHDQQRLDPPQRNRRAVRSEEHTSELQSRSDLVCRLLLEKKNDDDERRVFFRTRPPSFAPEESWGKVTAIDPPTGTIQCEHKVVTPPWGGVMATA